MDDLNVSLGTIRLSPALIFSNFWPAERALKEVNNLDEFVAISLEIIINYSATSKQVLEIYLKQ